MRAPGVAALVLAAFAAFAGAGKPSDPEALPDMGLAPNFVLVAQDGAEIALSSLRGKVVVVAFIYTWCADICPLLTDKMAWTQNELGAAFGKDVVFVSITFDPERDTPKALGEYAGAFDADPTGWFFLTGDSAAVRRVVNDYGVVTIPGMDGAIEHNLMTTLIDRHGRIRVQYAGYRFDSRELLWDLLALMAEE